MSKQVCVNVDDFGLHPAVNRAICNLSKQNYINSASLLANGGYVVEAIEMGLSINIGAHLNILRGCPISDGEKNS